MDPKSGGTNDSPSPDLKKVGGTVSPPSYAHVYAAYVRIRTLCF